MSVEISFKSKIYSLHHVIITLPETGLVVKLLKLEMGNSVVNFCSRPNKLLPVDIKNNEGIELVLLI